VVATDILPVSKSRKASDGVVIFLSLEKYRVGEKKFYSGLDFFEKARFILSRQIMKIILSPKSSIAVLSTGSRTF